MPTREARGFRSGGVHFSAHIWRFVQRWKQRLIDLRGLQHFVGPFALRDVEHQRAGSVGHIDGALAGQPEANVILRQHHRADALPVFRLEFADPQKFRQRKIRKRGIAGELDQPVGADELSKIATLLFGAHVAPDQRRTNDFAVLTEHHRAVHLPGEPDACDLLGFEFCGGDRFARRC